MNFHVTPALDEESTATIVAALDADYTPGGERWWDDGVFSAGFETMTGVIKVPAGWAAVEYCLVNNEVEVEVFATETDACDRAAEMVEAIRAEMIDLGLDPEECLTM